MSTPRIERRAKKATMVNRLAHISPLRYPGSALGMHSSDRVDMAAFCLFWSGSLSRHGPRGVEGRGGDNGSKQRPNTDAGPCGHGFDMTGL